MLRRMDVLLTKRQVLFYEYVTEDIVERRAPHRPFHIALLRKWMDEGRILMGGALGDPPTGALIVFADGGAEEFVEKDPYVVNGLVTSWRVEDWNVVS
ncbi:MAG: uncharacterized protein QOD86_60 [Miltoncostaeaceae bacterium]|nr:uncharacterized protein [Miltoncostaeaceae bacterium]